MKQEIQHFIALLRELQKIDTEFPLQYAICLSEISLDEGLCISDLADKTAMPLSTVSRITSALSQNKPNKKNYALIEIRPHATERRRKQLFISKKGHDLINNITKIIFQHKDVPYMIASNK